jgi:hypothetical protein
MTIGCMVVLTISLAIQPTARHQPHLNHPSLRGAMADGSSDRPGWLAFESG